MGGEEKVEAAFEVEAMELAQYGNWVIMETGEEEEDGEDEVCETSSTSTIDSFLENSIFSNESSSLELAEDASSSSSSASNPSLSSSPLSSGPLYELSELMASLPIKRGLSKFYHGKSQSFTSLSSAQSLEDLAKRVTIPQRKKMKSCKSYGGGLDAQRSSYSPKAIIAKKALKGISSSPVSKRNSGLFDSH